MGRRIKSKGRTSRVRNEAFEFERNPENLEGLRLVEDPIEFGSSTKKGEKKDLKNSNLGAMRYYKDV